MKWRSEASIDPCSEAGGQTCIHSEKLVMENIQLARSSLHKGKVLVLTMEWAEELKTTTLTSCAPLCTSKATQQNMKIEHIMNMELL